MIAAILLAALAVGIAGLSAIGVLQPREYGHALLYLHYPKPHPDGPYAVGRSTLQPKFGTDATQAVDVWYPAERPSKLAVFGETLLRPASPPYAVDVPILGTDERYPLLIYFPSWFGFRDQSTFTLANLASHGFVVIAVDDPVHGPKLTGAEAEAVATDIPLTSVKAMERYRPVAALRAQIGARYGKAAIDEVLQTSRFGDRVDPKRLGAFGFSFGGASAAQLSRIDSRVKAVINFDGSLYGEADRLGVDTPYMMFFSDFPLPTKAEETKGSPAEEISAILTREAIALQVQQSRPNNWAFTVGHIIHEDFSNKLINPGFGQALAKGPLNRADIWAKINRYVVAFFERFLESKEQPLLAETPFPEIRPFQERLRVSEKDAAPATAEASAK